MHFTVNIELGRFVLSAGLREEAEEESEEILLEEPSPEAVGADLSAEHTLPLGFGRWTEYDSEEAT